MEFEINCSLGAGGGYCDDPFLPSILMIGAMQAARKIKTMWRNSACLMLLSGHFKYRNPPLNDFLERKTLPNLLENTAAESTGENELLFVLRHAKSGFMVIIIYLLYIYIYILVYDIV